MARTEVSALGIEEQRVDAILELESTPEERANLGHGFSVYLRIEEWRSDKVLQIPLSALRRNGDNWVAFVTDGSRAEAREIELGRRNRDRAEVISGLSDGETVILHPGDAVTDGALIVDRSTLD